MNTPSLNFNLPAGWKVDFETEIEVSDNGSETYEMEHYFITTKDEDLVSSIYISKWLEAGHGCDVYQIIVEEAEEFFDSQNLTDDEKPDLDDYIKTFNIGNINVLFFVEPVVVDGIIHERAVFLHGVFQAPDRNIVFLRVFLNDWDEGFGEIRGVNILSNLFVF